MKMKQRKILNRIAIDFCEDGRDRKDYLACKIKEIQSNAKHILERSGKKGYSIVLSNDTESFVAASILADAFLPICLIVPENNSMAKKAAEILNQRYDDIMIQYINPLPLVQLVSESIEKGILIDTCDDYSAKQLISRIYMTLQYALSKDMLTAGCLTLERILTGKYTKNGRNFSDFSPLHRLIPEDIIELAELYDAPALSRYHLDDDIGGSVIAGITHNEVNSFLRGNFLEKPVMQKLINLYTNTGHDLLHPSENTVYEQEVGTHIVIDMIGAFIDGALACENAENAVNKTVDYINEHPSMQVLYVRDRHPEDHCSFDICGGPWPVHAVEGSDDDLFAVQLSRNIRKKMNTPLLNYNVFNKGEDSAFEEYSGFSAKNAQYGALKYNITKSVTVSGIATEFCVKNTVLDLLKNGFEVFIIKDALGYINKEDHLAVLAELEKAGAKLI